MTEGKIGVRQIEGGMIMTEGKIGGRQIEVGMIGGRTERKMITTEERTEGNEEAVLLEEETARTVLLDGEVRDVCCG